ncbi:MAG: hypothetical protein ACLP2U_00775 [Syntrophobacteraceae bacterium]
MKPNPDSKFLVIDTCIFRSAGRTDHPESRLSREFLAAVLKICHRIVFSRQLSAEWNRNRSNYSYRWLASMTARKKVLRIEDSQVVQNELREKLRDLPLDMEQRDAIEKDLPLIETALAADKLIISKDERMREILDAISSRIGMLKSCLWLNPVIEDSITWLKWLENGANMEPDKLLGAVSIKINAGEK